MIVGRTWSPKRSRSPSSSSAIASLGDLEPLWAPVSSSVKWSCYPGADRRGHDGASGVLSEEHSTPEMLPFQIAFPASGAGKEGTSQLGVSRPAFGSLSHKDKRWAWRGGGAGRRLPVIL